MSDHNPDASKEMAVEVKGARMSPNVEVKEMSKDEHRLATLGYRQVFIRSFGM